MKLDSISKGNLKTIAVVIGGCFFFYFLYKIQALILFAFISGVISLIGRPIVIFLKSRLKFGSALAAFSTLLIFIALIVFTLWIFVPIILDHHKNISEIDFNLVKRDLKELNVQASDYLGVERINIIEAAKRTEFVKNFNTDFILSFFKSFINNIGNLIFGLFAILFISFFLLRDEKIVIYSVTALAKPGEESRLIKVLRNVRVLLSRYFMGLLIQTFIIIFFYILILSYLDIKNPLAVGILCGMLNLVPYLGPLFGLGIMILIYISNNLGADFSSGLMPQLIILTLCVSIVQLIDNFVSQPIIFGKSVKSHPLEIFVVIVIGGLLFNVVGMVLAIPIYTTMKVISKEFLSEYKVVKRLTKNM